MSTQLSTVGELLAASVQAHAERPAVLRADGVVVCDYGALHRRIEAIDSALASLGVESGDVVMVTVPTSAEMLIAVLGAMRIGACAPMNPAYTQSEIADLADELQPAAVIVLDAQGGATAEVAHQRKIPCLRLRSEGAVIDPTAPVGNYPNRCPGDLALVLHTAGTTAKPKQVPLTHANLVAAATNVVQSLELTPSDRCLNVMPLFHSHGLLGAALSTLAAGASIVCADGMDPRHFLGWAVDNQCTWYTAAASIHQLVLDAPGEWPGLRFMRSASAPLAPQVAVALEARFGAPMIEVYGMTEAYQIAANPLPPGERRLGTVGLPTGTEVAVVDRVGDHLPAGEEGEVVVRGPAVFSGYSAPPGANDEAFFGEWFRTGDLGRFSDGYLSITGRRKEQINRGGEKIAPREVDEALLAHPDVVAAMAFAIPDPVLGEEIGAAIVARPGSAPDAHSVRAFLHGRIAPHKVPRRVLIVDELPKSSTGKLQRIGFAEAHSDALSTTVTGSVVHIDQHGSIQQRLSAIWQELLQMDRPPAPTEHFFDLGGTSLLTMELVAQIEDVFEVDLPVIDVLDVPTLEEMAVRVESAAPAGPTRLLHRYRRGSSGAHLVLVPGQMGMAIGLTLIADAVTADVDVWLFDYPGHRPGESPASSIEELGLRLVDEIDSVQIVGPLVLYGNSLGSWVAFEAARQLDARNQRPLVVGIGDLYSPWFNTKGSPTRPPLFTRLGNRLRRLQGDRLVPRSLDGATEGSPIAVQRRLAVTRASAVSLRKYPPLQYGGDVLVFAANERAPKFGNTLGWEHHVTGTIATLRLDGAHSSLHRDQAPEIGEALSQMFGRAPVAEANHR